MKIAVVGVGGLGGYIGGRLAQSGWNFAETPTLEHGRRLEIEAWNGALVRYGKAAGVPTPVNEVIYTCLKPYMNGWQTT